MHIAYYILFIIYMCYKVTLLIDHDIQAYLDIMSSKIISIFITIFSVSVYLAYT